MNARLPEPPAFRREHQPVVPRAESQAAILELVAMKACLLNVKVRTRGITHMQLAGEVRRLRHLLDEVEGKA